MPRLFFLIIAALAAAGTIRAADPRDYSWDDMAGSALPYPDDRRPVEVPDSLTPLMINHVGRHGARYPTSCARAERVRRFLLEAYDQATLTDAGLALLALADSVETEACGRWGELDTLGIAEQRELAARMFVSFPTLFGKGARVEAMATWKPRCVMSMDMFIHQLSLLNDGGLAVTSQSGTALTDTILRFFDINRDYRAKALTDTLQALSRAFNETDLSNAVVDRILLRLAGRESSLPADRAERRKIAEAAYGLVAGCRAMGIDVDPARWFTKDEYEHLWAADNFSQYLRYSASEVSAIPAAMAAPLLINIITTTDRFLAGESPTAVVLRFAHAETLMPLLSLMRIPGAYYAGSLRGSIVASQWRNFDLVPMAANLRITLFRATGSGTIYARVDLNERPIPLLSSAIYIPWATLRLHLLDLLPPIIHNS